MKKNIVALISFLILIIFFVTLIFCFKSEDISNKETKIQIIATLFPQYDFAKHIVGDKADVKLLLNSGVETHNYEPTPKDMIKINNSDMFLYTGTNLEPWTSGIVNNVNEKCQIVDISKGIELITIEEFEEKHINSNIIYEEHKEGHEEEIYDEHIWLNPLNAIKMIDNITKSISNIDSENADFYKKNAEEYKKQILSVDTELEELVKNANRKEIAVGGEFAYAYFIERYGLNFVSVYNNC